MITKKNVFSVCMYIMYSTLQSVFLITDSEAYKALENRHDKLARDFIKKEKPKFPPS
jgi:hypothetical protein